MSASDVIRRRGKRYNIQRPNAPTITDGYGIATDPDSATVFAHVQPLQPKELRNLEPGQNGSDWRNVWSLGIITLRDRIKIEGQWYTCQREAEWVEGDFWHTHVVRVMDQL